MDWDDVQTIRVRTKVLASSQRDARQRKVSLPSTPQLRKRRQTAKLVPIGPGGRIRLVNLPLGWKLGRRVFWKVTAHRQAIGSLSPRGTLHHGRYYSSRIHR